MSTLLYRDGFQIERFYATDLDEFSDDILLMLHFALHSHGEGLEHHDCLHQLLKGADGRFIRLFGGLDRAKGKLDHAGYERLSMDICKAFYLFKRGDYEGFTQVINEMEDVLRASVGRRRMGNNSASNRQPTDPP